MQAFMSICVNPLGILKHFLESPTQCQADRSLVTALVYYEHSAMYRHLADSQSIFLLIPPQFSDLTAAFLSPRRQPWIHILITVSLRNTCFLTHPPIFSQLMTVSVKICYFLLNFKMATIFKVGGAINLENLVFKTSFCKKILFCCSCCYALFCT